VRETGAIPILPSAVALTAVADRHTLPTDEAEQGDAKHHGEGQPCIIALRVTGSQWSQQCRNVEPISSDPAPQTNLLFYRQRKDSAADLTCPVCANKTFVVLPAERAGNTPGSQQLDQAQSNTVPAQQLAKLVSDAQRARPRTEDLGISLGASDI
jgi:hypothetical protein